MPFESNVPPGPIEEKWDEHKFSIKLVNPANKRRFRVLVIGTGLAGASAALHEEIGAPPWASVTSIQDRALADARDALGDAYAGHFAEGRGMSAEDAIAHLRSGSAGVAAPSTR